MKQSTLLTYSFSYLSWLSLLLFFILLLSAPPALAEDEVDDPQATIDSPFSPPLGVYSYHVSWGGISAGRATVRFSSDGEFYHVVAEARAVDGIDKIYRLRYRGESAIDAEDFNPIRTVLTSREGRKTKEKIIEYEDDGVVNTVVTNARKGKTPEVDHKEHQFEGLVFDPFSAIFLARQFEWHEGAAQEFEVFTGSSNYLVKLNAVARQDIEVAGEQREAWVIVPTVENLTNPEKDSKLESVAIYLSADERKDLLKIESKVFIGKILVTLDSFHPENPEAND